MDTKLNQRERIAINLILFCIKIIKPFQYSHEFKEEFEKLTKAVNE
jgi:hypothetical protein